MRGDRLARLVCFESLKLAAGVVLLSPFLPLLFMGEEYGEVAPFLYFVHHGDDGLIEAVRKGRKEEFAAFGWKGEIPDPQDEDTFLRSSPDPALRESGNHARPPGASPRADPDPEDRSGPVPDGPGRHGGVRLRKGKRPCRPAPQRARAGRGGVPFRGRAGVPPLSLPGGPWEKVLDSSDARWGGPGGAAPERPDPGRGIVCALRPHSFILLSKPGKENR